MQIKTLYFIEVPGQGRSQPYDDLYTAQAILLERTPQGRIVRQIQKIEISEEIIYPEGISCDKQETE